MRQHEPPLVLVVFAGRVDVDFLCRYVDRGNPDLILITASIILDDTKMRRNAAEQRVMVDKPAGSFCSGRVGTVLLFVSAGCCHGVGDTFCQMAGKAGGKMVVFSVCSIVCQRMGEAGHIALVWSSGTKILYTGARMVLC